MPGSFDLSPTATALTDEALPIFVCLCDPTATNAYTILPNLRCLQINYREGPEPPTARFQYLTADLLEANLGWPSQFEQLWPIDRAGELRRPDRRPLGGAYSHAIRQSQGTVRWVRANPSG